MADLRDLPLFAFEDALRRHRRQRRKLRRRGLALALGIAALCVTIVFPPRARLVWNASASVPIGLYRVGPARTLVPGDLVVVWLPGPARQLAAERRYLPSNVPAIKQVAAVAGMRVCWVGVALQIHGRKVARRLHADRFGRAMPQWEGCRTLAKGELLLLNPASPASFDGRYFGPSRTADVVGTAHPIWTWGAAETGT
ncbi:S26 family signal peptidase [Sphingomonas sp. FW199]|uniref:S26 family signal peptidase n=1 Tax=Sphingomonas sp. FW199 TaxID=3400217 RepID=UPI003CF8F592